MNLNNSYANFIDFEYDDNLFDNRTEFGDINLSMNHRVYDAVLNTAICRVVSDYFFNNVSTFGFSDYRGIDAMKVSESIKSEMKKWNYSLIVDKMSSYIMYAENFSVCNSGIDNLSIGSFEKHNIYLGYHTDYHDSKVLYFNDKLKFRFNVKQIKSKWMLFWQVDDNKTNHDAELIYYIVDDRGNRLLAKYRDRKLKKIL